MMKKLIVSVLLFGLSGIAAAASAEKASLADIRAQQTEIRSAVLERSGPYKNMPERRRTELAARQTKLLDLIEGKQSVKELDEQQKTEVFNALEWISAAITGKDDDRLICERTRPTGSHRTQRLCFTVAERRGHREGAGKMLVDRPLCWDGCNLGRRN